MRILKLLFIFIGLFVSLTLFSQNNNGVTGVVKFNNIANMEAVTPDTVNSHAVLALVKSKNQMWQYVDGDWVLVGDAPLQVNNTGNSVTLAYVNNILTANIAQQGATVNQTLQWTGTAWTPQNQIGVEVGLTDAGNHFTTDNVESALQQLGGLVSALNTLSGVAANATNLGTFTGNTIPDNVTIKPALQALETAIGSSLMVTNPASAYASDAAAGVGGVPVGGLYYLSNTNVYGAIENIIRKRKS